MKVKIFGSGSKGNTALLTDISGNQLIIDCGIKVKNYLTKLDFTKSLACFVTHSHGDHNAYTHQIAKYGVEVYSYANLMPNEPVTINQVWVLLPIPVKHGTCFNFGAIIFNKIEQKKILWFTDLEELPNIKDERYDLMAIECNYDERTEKDVFAHGGEIQTSNHTHLSLEKLTEWFAYRTIKPNTLMLQHTSNSGLLNVDRAVKECTDFAMTLYVAHKGLEFTI